MLTFDVDGSLDVSFNIHGLMVCHSDTSQSIPWQALDECPQTDCRSCFWVTYGKANKVLSMSKKYKMADAKTRGTCVSHPSFNEIITWIFEKGESHFRQIQSDLTRKQNYGFSCLFQLNFTVLCVRHFPVYLYL